MSANYRKLRDAVDSVHAAEEALEQAQTRLALAEQRQGFALRDCRQYHELSLRDVAERLNLSAPYLSDVENGRRHITDDNLERYMNLLAPIRTMKP